MKSLNIFHIFYVINCISLICLVKCSEFVPVYIWGTQDVDEQVSALHRVGIQSFKDDLLERLKTDPKVVVFVEETLSPEDFAQSDRSGGSAYPYLSEAPESKTTYFPYVQNPVKAVKSLNRKFLEFPAQKIAQSWEIPETEVIIINLNDAKDDEPRFDMLKRHDAFMSKVYDNILRKHSNVVAIYTSHLTSWVDKNAVNSRKSRSLLQAQMSENDANNSSTKYIVPNSPVYFYLTGSARYYDEESKEPVAIVFNQFEPKKNDSGDGSIGFTATGSDLVLMMRFARTASNYWNLDEVKVTYNGEEVINRTMSSTIYAPVTFSYHCGDQVFKNSKGTKALTLPGFQIQPIFEPTYRTNQTKFDDAYDCVGFTTVPIWSGLFVTFILLLIMTIGLTMMMDIKTMDRFDDAKGKTITIIASE